MQVLVIGQGAREHALVKALKKDPDVTKILATPGNAGIAEDATCLDFSVEDTNEITDFCKLEKIDLVIVGPEAALVKGITDQLNQENIACFGPTKAAAKIESSKGFAKKIMQETNVATAKSFECNDINQVVAAIDEFGAPFVIKDDQLAAGKGVVVTNEKNLALNHAKDCLAKPNGKVVVEEFLSGKEVSILFISDGETLIPLEPAQDYKRALDNDEGPNTGGMGAYSPVDWIEKSLVEKVKNEIAYPVIKRMKELNTPFVGVLYVGLIITTQGPKVIEFNARFGDPETQVILARLETPITQIFLNAVNGNLKNQPAPKWSDLKAVTVIRAAKGYPEHPELNDEITLSKENEYSYILHAGTKKIGEKLLSNGGRVLSIVGLGPDLTSARNRAYALNDQILFEKSHFRSDIADMER
ncbi:MAG: phosphoribosylamine--glycine ligase [Candidatus Nanopelagicales bacterium]